MNQLSGQDPEHVPDYRSLFSLEERVFMVLGGGTGIGRQSSHALAQAGATVVVVDRDGAAAAAVATEVGGVALTADVTRRSSVEGVFADATRYAGPVRGVVDSVGDLIPRCCRLLGRVPTDRRLVRSFGRQATRRRP